MPLTTAEFLETVRKSNLVDDKALDNYTQSVRAAGPLPEKAEDLAREMIRQGILTRFQAEHLLRGKWRRFTLGKYKILDRLGAGGMGSVYLCEHKHMRRRVAVKVLPETKSRDASSLERFYREARAVAALDHPNIVRAYDIDQDGDLHFLVMEYIDGINFYDLVRKHGPLDIGLAADYIRQAALGLQHAHERGGLVHRDIKPENLIVDRRGVVKVLDMGLARFFQDAEDQLTQAYNERVLGTVDWLAPEQMGDEEIDIRADIYSLGATLYFCLTGQTLFGSAGNIAIKRIWHQVRQPKPARTLRPEIPKALDELIMKMVAKNPAQRFQLPMEVAETLKPWARPAPPPLAEARAIP